MEKLLSLGSIWERTAFSCRGRQLMDRLYSARSCRACSFASSWRVNRHVSWQWKRAAAPTTDLSDGSAWP